MPKIIWYDIPDYPGYQCNRLGEIRSKRTGQILAPFDDQRGYLRVTLNGVNVKVHLIIAAMFVPKPHINTPLVVNHKRGNKHDNRASQLEWITQSDNIKHAWRLGLITRKRGKEHAHISD